MQKFTEMTKAELVQGIIAFSIPDVMGHENTLCMINMHDDTVPTTAVKLRDGKYYRADVDFDYFNHDSQELTWIESSRDEIVEIIENSYEDKSITFVRTKYLEFHWNNHMVNRVESLKAHLHAVLEVSSEMEKELEALKESKEE